MRFQQASFLILLTAFVCCGSLGQAQTANQADLSALRDASTVFIPASVAPEDKAAIVAQLKKDIPTIAVVERAEQASLVLSFTITVGDRARSRRRYVDISDPSSPTFRPQGRRDGRPQNPSSQGLVPVEDNTGFPNADTYERYATLVVERVGGERPVLAYAFSQRILAGRKTAATGYAKRFGKAWKKANRQSS